MRRRMQFYQRNSRASQAGPVLHAHLNSSADNLGKRNMGLCLLLPIVCGQELADSVNEEDSDNEDRRTQTKSIKKNSPMKSRQSESLPPVKKGKIKTTKRCLLCSRPVHSSSLIVGNRFSVNTPMMDERNSGIFCSCDTSCTR